MLYFSELKGMPVYTEDNVNVGTLNDVIFLAQENPLLTKVVLKTKLDPSSIISMKYIKRINGGIVLQKNFHTSKLEENELYISKNLLDNQIIDIAGDKIVRVNDVAIQEKPQYYIAGVDIGILGVLRWFGLEDAVSRIFNMFGKKLTSKFLSWVDIQTLELTRGHVKIKTEQTKLEKIRPEDLADYLEQTNVDNTKGILKILDKKRAAEVINNLNLNYQTALFKQFESDEAAKIISLIDPEEAADILATLSKKKREKIFSLLSDKTYGEINYLLSMSKTLIGSILTTEFLSVAPDQTVREIIDKVKQETGEFYSLTYVYVINQEKQVVGVFDLHQLLLQQLDTHIYKFMTPNLAVIYLSTPIRVALRKLLKYKLFALPVVDRDKHMLGVVMFDDVSNFLIEKNNG